mmetsp:Transcript_3869/g.12533  ORF Transcript_3869/g.12533 Transcript_3869/m.12533 type:complete len:290 (+) Transcript_3869:503-1372(+)
MHVTVLPQVLAVTSLLAALPALEVLAAALSPLLPALTGIGVQVAIDARGVLIVVVHSLFRVAQIVRWTACALLTLRGVAIAVPVLALPALLALHLLKGHLHIVPAQTAEDLVVEVLQVKVRRVTVVVCAVQLPTDVGIFLALMRGQVVAAPHGVLLEAIAASVRDLEGTADAFLRAVAVHGAARAAEPVTGSAATGAPGKEWVHSVQVLAVHGSGVGCQGPPILGHGVRISASASSLGLVIVARGAGAHLVIVHGRASRALAHLRKVLALAAVAVMHSRIMDNQQGQPA